MTEQAPKPLEDILAAVRSTLLPSPDDALVRALIETIEARIEQDRQEIAALRERVEQATVADIPIDTLGPPNREEREGIGCGECRICTQCAVAQAKAMEALRATIKGLENIIIRRVPDHPEAEAILAKRRRDD